MRSSRCRTCRRWSGSARSKVSTLGRIGRLAEVVLDHVGHEGVDGLVVGHAVADGVGDRHVAGAGGVEQPGDAEQRVGYEVHRVEVLVVDPPVDDVHGPRAADRAHPEPVVTAEQVAALDELGTHAAVPGRRARSGRSCARPGVSTATVGSATSGRRRGAQRVEQALGVLDHRAHLLAREHLGQHVRQRTPVLQDVGDPARAAQVVLEHAELADLVTDEVDAGHVDADAVRRHEPVRRAVVVVRRVTSRRGTMPSSSTSPAPYTSARNDLERPDPLADAGSTRSHSSAADDAGDEVERQRPLAAGQGERDALTVEVGVAQPGPLGQPLGAEPVQDGGDARPCPARGLAGRVDHLVVGGEALRRRRPGAHGRSLAPAVSAAANGVTGVSAPRRRRHQPGASPRSVPARGPGRDLRMSTGSMSWALPPRGPRGPQCRHDTGYSLRGSTRSRGRVEAALQARGRARRRAQPVLARARRWGPDLSAGVHAVFADPGPGGARRPARRGRVRRLGSPAPTRCASATPSACCVPTGSSRPTPWATSPTPTGSPARSRESPSTSTTCASWGTTYLHLMPLLQPRSGANDGGYAVADYRSVRADLGTMGDLETARVRPPRQRHRAHDRPRPQPRRRRARVGGCGASGRPEVPRYFLVFHDRTEPDRYERTLPEVFPDFAPGNFTWDDELDGWVWTTFNSYQWDLNWSNPDVVAEFADLIALPRQQGRRLPAPRRDRVPLEAPGHQLPEPARGARPHPSAARGGADRRAVAGVQGRGDRVAGRPRAVPGVGEYAGPVSRPRLPQQPHGPDLVGARDERRAAPGPRRSTSFPSEADHHGVGDVPPLPRRHRLGVDDADAAAVGWNGYAHRRFLSQWFVG